jgi:hypothetical protein
MEKARLLHHNANLELLKRKPRPGHRRSFFVFMHGFCTQAIYSPAVGGIPFALLA